MTFIGDGMDKIGVLLLNMGGPDSLNAVRPFLYNLFNDPYIANFGILQKPMAWLISTFRSKKVKEAYKQIGGKSPLKDITLKQAELLEKALGENFSVKVGMNYWHPFIDESLGDFEKEGIKKIIVLSLYPQYCKATTGSAIASFKKKAKATLDYIIIDSWCEHPLFIEAWCEKIVEIFNNHLIGFVLFSAHGIPISLYKNGDPYISEVEKTVKAIVRNLSLTEWSISYQSRTGPVKWVEPSTEKTLEELSKKRLEKVFIVPISFVSDHIETLYEIDIVYKEMSNKMGLDLIRVPSLNTSTKFIEALKAIVLESINGGK